MIVKVVAQAQGDAFGSFGCQPAAQKRKSPLEYRKPKKPECDERKHAKFIFPQDGIDKIAQQQICGSLENSSEPLAYR